MSQTVFQRIHVSQFRVDPIVQRSTDPNRAATMAQKFDPDAAGALVVNQRHDGYYYIIDGGHRFAAAVIAKYEGKLNCVVHQQLPVEKEAELFLALNDSKLVQAIDKFRVRVVAQEKDAAMISSLLERYGWHVAGGTAPGCFAAVTALEKVYNGAGVLSDQHPELAEAVLVAITRAWGHDPAGAHATIVGGLGQLFARFGGDVNIDKLVREMSKLRPVELVAKSRNLKDSQGGTVPAAAARILVNSYNKALRTNRLPDWRWTR